MTVVFKLRKSDSVLLKALNSMCMLTSLATDI